MGLRSQKCQAAIQKMQPWVKRCQFRNGSISHYIADSSRNTQQTRFMGIIDRILCNSMMGMIVLPSGGYLKYHAAI